MGFQVSPSERETLAKRAAEAGVSLSEYVRAAALGYRLDPPRAPITERALQELWAIGNNLNQIAHRANATDRIDSDQLAAALTHWRDFVGRLHE